jgi:hypothetical protein
MIYNEAHKYFFGDFVVDCDWCEDTMLMFATQFITDRDLTKEFGVYLAQQAAEENKHIAINEIEEKYL